jgi:hypothetical protein
MSYIWAVMKGKRINYYVSLLVCTALLMLPAMYNHYPLMDPDAGTYIASGFKPETPFDRPITYGLLLRLFSLNGLSLWMTIAAQAFVMSWLIGRVLNLFFIPERLPVINVLVVLFLSQCTSLPWLVSMIHPDIFTSIACLCITLLLAGDKNKIYLYVLFWISIAVHMSHPVLFSGMLLVLFLSKRIYMQRLWFRDVRNKTIILAALSLSGLAVMGSALSKSKHVFFTGTLVEKGVLQVYLKEQCANKNYQLCAYKDQLPTTSDEFVWVSSSPLYKVGDWAGSKKEFSEIDKDVMTTPRYLWLYIKSSIAQFGRQALSFDIGTGTFSFKTGTNVNEQMRMYMPGELAQFNADFQNNTDLPARLKWVNIILRTIVSTSCAILIYFLFFRWKKLLPALRTVVFTLVTGVLINCADFAALSVVVGRYGAKMIWLLPFCALLCLMTIKRENNEYI